MCNGPPKVNSELYAADKEDDVGDNFHKNQNI